MAGKRGSRGKEKATENGKAAHMDPKSGDARAEGASADGDVVECRFKHLLEPIRDLALNWNIDIAQVRSCNHHSRLRCWMWQQSWCMAEAAAATVTAAAASAVSLQHTNQRRWLSRSSSTTSASWNR